MSTRALIVDDHPIIRSALETSLLSLNIFEEVDNASCFQELIDKLSVDSQYQLLILDLSLTDISGSDGMVYIREHYPEIPIVIFSGSDSSDIISQCFENGVHGFVSKNSSMQIFVHAIQLVLAGGTYIPPAAIRFMGFEPSEFGVSPEVESKEKVHLTPKQREVFQQLMLGVPNKVIAKRLDMAEGTVKAHLHGIYQLLRVTNRAQAILRSQQLQLLN
jgi:DNA-binding NarL/FixJ family response regulator